MTPLEELGAVFKEKNPEYRDLTNEEAGRMLKAARPELYGDVIDTSIAVRGKENPLERRVGADNDSVQKATQLQQDFNPKAGRLQNWLKAWKARGHQKTLDFITPAMASVIEQGAMLERAALDSARRQQEFQSWVVHNQYDLFVLQQNSYLLEQATEQGLTVEGLEKKNLAINETTQTLRVIEQENEFKLRFEQSMANIRRQVADEEHQYQVNMENVRTNNDIRKAQAEHDRNMEKLRQDHFLALEEYKAQTQTKTDNEIRLATEQLKLDIIEQHLTKQQEISHIQDLIEIQYAIISEAKLNTKRLPQEEVNAIVEGRMRIIRMYEAQQVENHNGILQRRQIR